MEKEFRQRELHREGRPRCAGAELKFPVVKSDGSAVNYHSMVRLWHFLAERGWQPMRDPGVPDPVGVTWPRHNRHDIITTETSFCKLEVALAYEDNLFSLSRRLEDVKELLREFGAREGVLFLGLGMQPVSPPSDLLMSGKSRNLFWNKVFGNGRVHLFTVSATNQAHIDVTMAESASAVNVFNGLSGAQIALTANSTVRRGKIDQEFCALAEDFWYRWLPGDARVGMTARPFTDWEDYMRHICSFRPVFVVRGGSYLGIYRYDSFAGYVAAGKDARGEDETGNRVPLEPCYADLNRHFTFCWHDARLSEYFTLENRVNCQQPPGEELSVTALSLGLLENLDEAAELVRSYPWETLRQLHDAAVRQGPQAEAEGIPVMELARQMFNLSVLGLKKRDLGEEIFLAPLWHRLERARCPAFKARETMAAGGIPALLEEFSM